MDFDDDTFGSSDAPAVVESSQAPAFETEDDGFLVEQPAAAPAQQQDDMFGGDDDFMGGSSSGHQPAAAEEEEEQHAAPASENNFDDDFGMGSAPAPAPAPAAGGFDFDAGEDDFMGSAPAPAPAPAPAVAAPSPAAAPTPSPSARFGDIEETPFTIWQKNHQVHLQKKSEESKVKHDEAKAKATAWIQEFYQERSLKFDKIQRVNRDNEREAIIAVENGLVTGPSWERVCGLVDLQAKTDSRDTSRMRQVLLQVKAHPPPHMQAA